MSRSRKILRNVAIVTAAALIVLSLAVIVVVQTDFFRNYVTQTIISSTADSSGGKVDLGSFRFDWTHLHAEVTDFVMHGTEPSGTEPLIRIAKVTIDLRLFTSFHRLWDIAHVAVEEPKANIIFYPDGRTNLPAPRRKPKSNESPLETLVDLSIGRFELNHGFITVDAQRQELSVRGNNLRVQFSYNTLQQDYSGQISLQPLYMVSGRNTPVDLSIRVPLVLGRDRIEVHDANITSAQSTLALNISLEDLKKPRVSSQIHGRVALADLTAAGIGPALSQGSDIPWNVAVDARLTAGANSLDIASLRLSLGHSSVEATGDVYRDLQFKSQLALAELARLSNLSSDLDGFADINGTATLDHQDNIDFKKLQVQALGGELIGHASLRDFERYQLHGDLRHLDLANALAVGRVSLPYDGVISGAVDAAGSLRAPAVRSIMAQAKLSIAPGSHGIPLDGHLDAGYNGAADNLTVQDSVFTLPHSRIQVNGEFGKQLTVDLTTANLADFLMALPESSRPKVALDGGQMTFDATVTGRLSDPKVVGRLTANRVSFAGRRFDRLNADISLTKGNVRIQDASLRRDTMSAQFSGDLGLRDWKPVDDESLSATASIQGGDLADVLALAGYSGTDYSGQLSADLSVNGTLGNPLGSAMVVATRGVIQGQPFDRAQAQVNLTDRLITVPAASIQLGSEQVNLSGALHHPPDSFTTGQARVSVQGDRVDLAQVTAVQKKWPETAGMVKLNADATIELTSGGAPQLSAAGGNLEVKGLRWQAHDCSDLNASAATTSQSLTYTVTSNFAGSDLSVKGATELTSGYATTASATLRGLPVQRALAIANRNDVPVKGTLSGTLNVTGPIRDPQGNADLTLANAVAYEEAIDRVHARVSYTAKSIDLPQFEATAGPSRVDLTAQYDRVSRNLQFRLGTNRIDFGRLKTVTRRVPGLAGGIQIEATGAAEVRTAEPRILVRDLRGSVKTAGLTMNGKAAGEVSLTANTSAGRVNLAVDSTLAGATVRGGGNVQLAETYPADLQLTVSNASWAKVAPLLNSGLGKAASFDAVADGKLSLNGPLTTRRQLRGQFEITRFEMSSISGLLRNAGAVLLQNQGPIKATLDSGLINIQSAHLTGPQTNLQASGTAPIDGRAIDVTLNGAMNLAILEKLDPSFSSQGSIALGASVRGTFAKPLLNGQIELRDATFADYPTLPVGISKANGVVVFNGSTAVIRNLTAEAGGGKLTLAGSASFGDTLDVRAQARATRVRVQVQRGVSAVVSANINVTGTNESGLISGAVTIDQLSYAPQSDLGSLLSIAAPPVQAPSASPFLQNTRLDLRVRSSSALAVQASLAQNLQLDADLRVRGTVAQPGFLGRVNITGGKLVFFGNEYTINGGTIGFFNPVRIDPVMNLSLETKTQGVDVVVKVTGPLEDMKLSYTSDPPFPFQEIIALLAGGTTPTSDPTLLANEPSQAPQSFQQMGESALLSKALTDPVSNRLQRVFGVTQLKINPTFASGSQLPAAQVTLQQKIANNITFTYVTDLNTANAETVRVDWTFNPEWSAEAIRDYNGIFSVRLLYKRQLR